MRHSDNLDKIAPALVKVQAACKGVAKSGENKFDRYKYADLEDYLDVVKPKLGEFGVAVVCSISEVDRLEDRATAQGKSEHAVQVALDITLLHESGQWIMVTMYGEGQDRADKAIYKAITGARKYATAATFNLATSDDPERDETVGGNNDRQAPPHRPFPTQGQPQQPQQPQQQFQRPVTNNVTNNVTNVTNSTPATTNRPAQPVANAPVAPVPPAQPARRPATETPVKVSPVAATVASTTAPAADGAKPIAGHSGDPTPAAAADDMTAKCTADVPEMVTLRSLLNSNGIKDRKHCIALINHFLDKDSSSEGAIKVITDMTRADAKRVCDNMSTSNTAALTEIIKSKSL
jgi:hypothetical protein